MPPLLVRLTALALLVAVGTALDVSGVGAARPAAARPVFQSPALDPSRPGQYGIGVTRRTLERVSSTTGAPRPLELVIWYPSTVSADAAPDPQLWAVVDGEPARKGGPYPVVVWSHGGESEPWSSTFFTTHLASHGFVVVAPPHAGTRTGDCPDPCDLTRFLELPATREAAMNRPDELTAARERVVALGAGGDPLLGGLVDGGRVGVAGHSIGAASAIVAAGTDSRFRGVVAMATTPSDQTIVRQGASRVTVPTMLMGGGRDTLHPAPRLRQLYGAFGDAVKERWLVLLPRAGHLAFQDDCAASAPGCGPNDLAQERAHQLVDRWATAFMLRYVAGDERYAPFLDPAATDGGEVDVSFGTGA